MKYCKRIFICLCLLYLPGQAIGQAEQFEEIRQTIETAVDSLQPEKLIELNSRLASLTKSQDPQVRKYTYYYRGYSNYRLQNSFPQIEEDQKEKYLDAAVEMFEKAVALDSNFAEAQAMLGSCYGMKASSGFFAGMKYGPKSSSALKRALELAPGNPRVVLLDAIGTLFKPGVFGGSTEGAIEGFQKASELYKNWQPPNEFAPRWGDAEVYAWLGQGYAQAGEYKKAKEAYQQALRVKPGYPWVEDKLMAELNKEAD